MIKIKTEILKKIVLIETHLNADYDYFIENINYGIENSPQNFTTNVKGFMTPWNFFCKDEKFLEEIAIPTFNIIEDDKELIEPWELAECWGIKQNKSHYTKLHNHGNSVYSCIFYLNDHDNNLIIPELDKEIVPKKGKLVIFTGSLYHRTRRIINNESRYALVFNLNYQGVK
jgi:hypothetical protein